MWGDRGKTDELSLNYITTKLTGGNGAQWDCRPVQRLDMHLYRMHETINFSFKDSRVIDFAFPNHHNIPSELL